MDCDTNNLALALLYDRGRKLVAISTTIPTSMNPDKNREILGILGSVDVKEKTVFISLPVVRVEGRLTSLRAARGDGVG